MNNNGTSIETGIAIADDMLRLSRILIQRCGRALESVSIGVGQFPILKLLNDHGTLTQRQIAEELNVTPATICSAVKRMERAALISRSSAREDARLTRISLTEEGRSRLNTAIDILQQTHREMLSGFDETDCRQMDGFFRRMEENLMSSAAVGEEA